MSWDATRFGRTVTHAGGVLKKNLWLWPVIAIAILSVIGFTANHAIESTIKESLQSQLQTLLNAESEMLVKWFEVQAANAETVANDVEVRHLINSMLDTNADSQSSDASTSRSKANEELKAALSPLMSSQGYIGFFVVDIHFEIIASSYVVMIGQKEIPEYEPFLTRVLEGKGQTIVSKPFRSVVMLKDENDQVRTGEPTMYVCAPVRDENFQVTGVLALQLRPEAEFTQILQLGRIGESGETYAFDTEGVMVSNSRFDDNLILLGILADQANARSILNVLVRDPGGDMTEGFRPSERRAYMPLTYMAADASSGNSGVDVDGYRDYRGVQVVGAWRWLKDYEIGVATEIAKSEAFRPLTILRRTFWRSMPCWSSARLPSSVSPLPSLDCKARLKKRRSRRSNWDSTGWKRNSVPVRWESFTKATTRCCVDRPRSSCWMSIRSTTSPSRGSSAKFKSRAS